jgi:hypothetical protein
MYVRECRRFSGSDELVGSRNGAILRRSDLSGPPRFLWECLTNRTVSWFPSPATSNGACRFPALRSPARFAERFMRRSQLEVLSIRCGHQHLLHTIQPLPPSSSCISSVSGLADCRALLSDAPASHHCQRNYETAGFLRSLGVTPVHRYCKPFRHLLAFLPFPGLAGYRSGLLQSLSLWDE